MASKPGTVGQNMPKALKGEVDGSISYKYKGPPRNAIPNYPHNPHNSRSVGQWTQDHMQNRRKENAKKQ